MVCLAMLGFTYYDFHPEKMIQFYECRDAASRVLFLSADTVFRQTLLRFENIPLLLMQYHYKDVVSTRSFLHISLIAKITKP